MDDAYVYEMKCNYVEAKHLGCYISSVATHNRGGTLHRRAYGDVDATKSGLGRSLVIEGTYEWVQHLD